MTPKGREVPGDDGRIGYHCPWNRALIARPIARVKSASTAARGVPSALARTKTMLNWKEAAERRRVIESGSGDMQPCGAGKRKSQWRVEHASSGFRMRDGDLSERSRPELGFGTAGRGMAFPGARGVQ